MAKVTRKRLARGTKLTSDHIQTPLGDIATQVNLGDIEHEQLEAENGTFRINLHIPYMASDFPFSVAPVVGGGTSGTMSRGGFGIPFTLPPAQEMFSAQPNFFSISEDQPHFVLEELSFSFDQRAEPAAIKDHLSSGPLPADQLNVLKMGSTGPAQAIQGTMDFDEVTSYDMSLSILEKPQEYFGESEPFFQKTLFSAPISYNLFQSDVRRFNPLIIRNINATLSPFKTYAFVIKAPSLGQTPEKPDDRKSHALVSVQISMKVRATLVQRDLYDAVSNPLQNWPTKDSNMARRTPGLVGQSVVVTPPGVGAPILADTGSADTSVSLVMGKVDDVFRGGLSGGVDENCEPAAKQQLLDDASYDIMAFPLMNNRRFGGIISRYVTDEPYCPDQAADIWDRRILPLHYPFVIHHIVLAWNWNRFFAAAPTAAPGAFSTAGFAPASDTFTVEIGVGIGEGIRSDGRGYQQIARLELVNPANPHQPSATWRSTMIDRCTVNPGSIQDPANPYQGNGALRVGMGTSGNYLWEWELHQVPLVRGAYNGTGYFTQGPPVFVGKSWTPTSARTVIAGAPSAIVGREDFLEIRMKISDSGGFPRNDEVVSGYQGHWVYIIGKKFLTR